MPSLYNRIWYYLVFGGFLACSVRNSLERE
jgi:hypothetical protein